MANSKMNIENGKIMKEIISIIWFSNMLAMNHILNEIANKKMKYK